MSSATVPLPVGTAVDGNDVIWRRFDDRNPAYYDAVTVDEQSGESRLKGYAFRFDEDGCSVFSQQAIVKLGLRPGAIATRQHSALASARCGDVNCFESGLAIDTGQEFRVVPDPLEPPPPFNPAHTLIEHHGVYGSKGKRRLAIHQLARRVFTAPK